MRQVAILRDTERAASLRRSRGKEIQGSIDSAAVGRLLPNYEAAHILPAKLRDYALNPDHEIGGPKARIFRSILGFDRDDWEELSEKLRAGLARTPISLIRPGSGKKATTYTALIAVTGKNGRTAPVVTAWQIVDGVPRLVTAYIDKRRVDDIADRE